LERRIADHDLNLHKQAPLKKLEELKQRDETINTQNCLLGLAWADAQNLASSQMEAERTMALMNGYIEGMTTIKEETNANKKRRLSP
jgi:hypothetical protein